MQQFIDLIFEAKKRGDLLAVQTFFIIHHNWGGNNAELSMAVAMLEYSEMTQEEDHYDFDTQE